jgi:hypothetical protein
MIEGCPGVDIEMLADLPYRRGIASLLDKSSNKIKDLSLPGRQFHDSLSKLISVYQNNRLSVSGYQKIRYQVFI